MNRRKMILVAVVLVVLIAALGLSVRAATRKPKLDIAAPRPDRLDDLKTFLVNPEKLGSPDIPDDWKRTDPELMRLLRELSVKVGRKIEVNSGHRSAAHNQAVGGVANSSHLSYKAADLHAGSPDKALALAKAAAQVGFKRIGVGRTFVHLDVDYSKNYPTAWGKEFYSTSPYTKSQLMPLLFP